MPSATRRRRRHRGAGRANSRSAGTKRARAANEAAAACPVCLQPLDAEACNRQPGHVPPAPFDEERDAAAASDERQVVVTPCRHCFHRGCMRSWLDVHLVNARCPMCRAKLPNAFKAAAYGGPLPQPAVARGAAVRELLNAADADGDGAFRADVEDAEARIRAGRHAAALAVLPPDDGEGAADDGGERAAARLRLLVRHFAKPATAAWFDACLLGQDAAWAADMLRLLTGVNAAAFPAIAGAMKFATQDAALLAARRGEGGAAPLRPPSDAPVLRRVDADAADAAARRHAAGVRAYFAPLLAARNPRVGENAAAFVDAFFNGSARSLALTHAALTAALTGAVPDAAILQAAYSVWRYPALRDA
jgi:hypothetical protein